MSRQVAVQSRQKLFEEIHRLADVAIFGTLSESYRTCGRQACRCYSGGPKHGPHLHISYRGDEGKTTGYYVPKAAESSVRAGVVAWNRLLERLYKLADFNARRVMAEARTAGSPGSPESRPKVASGRARSQRPGRKDMETAG